MPKTEVIDRSRDAQADPRRPHTWLVRVGSALDTRLPPLVVRLDDRERLELGRQDGPPTGDENRLECMDRSMSGTHAAIERTTGGWQLRDLGSSNGTLVWGRPQSTHALEDGDVFETGSTFWLFRTALLADDELPGPEPDPVLGSVHPDLAGVGADLDRVAGTRVPIMLFGATGTGKEVLARAIHARSGREGPFVAINTAAVQRNLVASELFGVEEGAHSMAERSRAGQIRTAHKGTILLDEIGDMPLEVQVSLLRVIQENEILPVGGDRPVPIDVRFLCATHQDLATLVEQGSFRADLFARLKGKIFDIPRLRDRREDVGRLVGVFMRRYEGGDLDFAPHAYRALLTYDWPLNVRELEKTVETAIALAGGGRIELEHLPAEIRQYVPERATNQARAPEDDQARRRELERLLTAHGGNVSAVARSMGYSRMQVHRWIKSFELDPAAYRAGRASS